MTTTTFLIPRSVGQFNALEDAEATFLALLGQNHYLFTITDRTIISATTGDGREFWAVGIEWQPAYKGATY